MQATSACVFGRCNFAVRSVLFAPVNSATLSLRWPTMWKAALLFVAAFLLYFLTRSPYLDEWDSVQFAMGIREFNLWKHQPHPPGYPVYIFLGWLGNSLFSLDPADALHLVSCFGGALFVTAWFGILRLHFGERSHGSPPAP